MAKKTTATKVKHVIDITRDMGNSLNDMYLETNDLKVAQMSLKAYGTAINAAKAQIVYKKLTGKPTKIAFMED